MSVTTGRPPLPRHVAVIMDGNGRWAAARGRPRAAGHRMGAKAARAIIEAARTAGIETLTLYAFSADNWQRPTGEVGGIMNLLRTNLLAEAGNCLANGIRLGVIGRRDRLSAPVAEAIARAEHITRHGRAMHLRLAVDYSSRDLILQAARAHATRPAEPWDFDAFGVTLGKVGGAAAASDVDLLIRTGGEVRLSDFLLWECAYAEFVFSPHLWPDYGPAEFACALAEFAQRDRRYGGLPTAIER